MGLLRHNASVSTATTSLVPLAQALNAGTVALVQPEHCQQGLQVLQQVVLQVKSATASCRAEPRPIRVAPLYQQDECRHTFLHPFVVHVPEHGRMSPGTKRAMLSIAFFNMAVAHDLQAASSTTGHQERHYGLSQAHATYLYALELLDVPELIDPDGSLIYVYLALCLNLDHVESALGVTRTHGTGFLRQTRMEALENAFWTITPNPECPVYQHFERTTSSQCPY